MKLHSSRCSVVKGVRVWSSACCASFGERARYFATAKHIRLVSAMLCTCTLIRETEMDHPAVPPCRSRKQDRRQTSDFCEPFLQRFYIYFDETYFFHRVPATRLLLPTAFFVSRSHLHLDWCVSAMSPLPLSGIYSFASSVVLCFHSDDEYSSNISARQRLFDSRPSVCATCGGEPTPSRGSVLPSANARDT
jgi:hypothetical protein